MNSNNFEFLYIIGRGGFGKVWKVKSKKTNKYYALKQMSKVKIIDKKSIKSINSERELLSKIYNPFIVNMHYAFQDDKYLYLVMDLMSGGDLRYHISMHKKFSEEQTRFFICGITLSLEYIHQNNIIHRDVKPENLVLDENGYIRLTDFGIAKINTRDNSSETSGTPGYMSPEVIKSLNHSFPVDFFALGVIGYEFFKGERPYVGNNRKEIKEQIISRQAEIKMEEIKNEDWSKESIDFINKLLIRKPEERLGYKKGVEELKEHPWLRYYPWDLFKNKTLPSPFVPQNKNNFDSRYCNGIDYIGEETKIRYEEILSDDNFEFYFRNFYYNIDDDKNRNKSIVNEKKINISKDKTKNMNKVNKLYEIFTRINKSNNSKNLKIKKDKNNIKCENQNLILINFNINNITNNNINKNKISNYYLNKSNIKSEKLKKIEKKIIVNNHRNKKTINYNIDLNDFSLNQFSLRSPINSSIKLPIKNYTYNTNSKSKSKNKKGNKYNYNNSLIKKLTKIDISQVRLLKNKKIKNIGKFFHNINSQIYSISYSNRENSNYNKIKDKSNSLNIIFSNEGDLNNSRKINNFKNNKDFSSKDKNIIPFISKKIIFDKKILLAKKNNSINNKKFVKNGIPFYKYKYNYESILKNENNKTIENKNVIKNILELFKRNKKSRYNSDNSYHSKNKKYKGNNNIFKKYKYNNISTYNLDKDNILKYYSERLKCSKTNFSNL